VNYRQLYYASVYSCGCRRRPQKNGGIEYAGLKVWNSAGNRGIEGAAIGQKPGRGLEVIGRDYETDLWQAACSCCAGIFVVPRGYARNFARTLKDMAGETCPNWKRFYPYGGEFDWRMEQYTRQFGFHYVSLRGIVPYLPGMPGMSSRDRAAEALATFYEPRNVKRVDGKIRGFFGEPTKPIPPEYRLKNMLSQTAVDQREWDKDLDEFTEMMRMQ
jgi:hypothetical protein